MYLLYIYTYIYIYIYIYTYLIINSLQNDIQMHTWERDIAASTPKIGTQYWLESTCTPTSPEMAQKFWWPTFALQQVPLSWLCLECWWPPLWLGSCFGVLGLILVENKKKMSSYISYSWIYVHIYIHTYLHQYVHTSSFLWCQSMSSCNTVLAHFGETEEDIRKWTLF